MKVDFYQLTAQPLDRVLPQIAEKVIASGERLLIVAGGEEQRRHLDLLLWSYAPDSFLPHAQLGGEDDTAQPILIAPDVNAANRARHVALVDGTWRDDALDFDRAFHFFDEATIDAARAAWRTLKDREGVTRNFWRQDGGKWAKVA